MPVSLQHSLTLENLDQHMVSIFAGSFDMGGESKYKDAKPVHRVQLNAFQICRFPVTQELWETINGNNPSKYKGPQRPVEQISWYDAQIFIEALNNNTGGKYRLPTEAEWEFAARGGAIKSVYTYAGSRKLEETGWYNENSYFETQKIGQNPPNSLGLHDMSGNVYEWCLDWYNEKYYQNSPKINPTGPAHGEYRVVRGGSWDFYTYSCRTMARERLQPTVLDSNIGFRLARSI